MEILQQLTNFYDTIAEDARIGVTHICLYMALVHESSISLSGSPVCITRHSLMKNARISRKTYNKCMKELQQYGYIKYEPSSNPSTGSKVYLNKL
ncbi:MAG: hypothetical protein ABI675_22505 [Chitinophagaceae bacterium]